MKKILICSFLIAGWMLAMTPDVAHAWGYGYHHYRHAPYPIVVAPHGYYRGSWGPPLGRIEIETEPTDAAVYVDGYYVGTAGKLDGWPTFLWLRQGTYELTIVHPEYKTINHTIAVFPRQRMTLETPMELGESTPPPKPKKAPRPETAEKAEPAGR
ncbi:MAG: PEGA domain-containing protein [Acidobacteriota bacterium]